MIGMSRVRSLRRRLHHVVALGMMPVVLLMGVGQVQSCACHGSTRGVHRCCCDPTHLAGGTIARHACCHGAGAAAGSHRESAAHCHRHDSRLPCGGRVATGTCGCVHAAQVESIPTLTEAARAADGHEAPTLLAVVADSLSTSLQHLAHRGDATEVAYAGGDLVISLHRLVI